MNVCEHECEEYLHMHKYSSNDSVKVLFLHLIPLCQNVEEGHKREFEQCMNTKKLTFDESKRVGLISYLESHPKNKGQWYGRISLDYHMQLENNHQDRTDNIVQCFDFVDNHAGVTFEKILIMMRNIHYYICHEHSFVWEDTIQMSLLAEAYFKSFTVIAEVMKLYYIEVVKRYYNSSTGQQDDDWLTVPLFPSQTPISPIFETHCKFTQVQVQQVWDAIIQFSWLIPCRANNSLVDSSFNTNIEKIQNWDGFSMYIVTHPANPEQSILTEITWIQAIRLMRNILCHETSFSWRGLLEFQDHIIAMFGSKERFDQVLIAYQEYCSVPPHQINNSISSVARIQLSNPENCILLPDRIESKRDSGYREWMMKNCFVGLEPVMPVTRKWRGAIKRGDAVLCLVLGAPKSGRTTLGEFVLPHVLQLPNVVIDCSAILVYQELCDIFTSNNITEKSNPTFIFLDDFDTSFKDEQAKIMAFQFLLKYASRHYIVLSGSLLLPFKLDALKKKIGQKTVIQFMVVHTLNPPPSSPHPSAGSPPHAPHRDHFMHTTVCDAQVLFRFYNKIEKWKMRQIALELGCAALTPAHLWQSICNYGPVSHVESVMCNLWPYTLGFCKQFPDTFMILKRFLYPGATKPKGWCWSPLVEEKERYTLKPDLVIHQGKVVSPISTNTSGCIDWLDLLYMTQLSSVYVSSPITEIGDTFNSAEIQLKSKDVISIVHSTTTSSAKRKLESTEEEHNESKRSNLNCSDLSLGPIIDLKNQFEVEMTLFEGFRFGPIVSFISSLQSIYSSLFGNSKPWTYDNKLYPWTWIMHTMALIFCQPAIWVPECFPLLESFIKQVVCFFKNDRDLLRNVILLYRKCML